MAHRLLMIQGMKANNIVEIAFMVAWRSFRFGGAWRETIAPEVLPYGQRTLGKVAGIVMGLRTGMVAK